MSKPTTVYVHNTPHIPLGLAVEGALDGHGSLGGFHDFLESEFEAFRGIKHFPDAEPEAWTRFSREIRQQPTRWLDPASHDTYRELFRSASAALPFPELSPPTAPHLLALFMHLQAGTGSVYTTDCEFRVDGSSEARSAHKTGCYLDGLSWSDLSRLTRLGFTAGMAKEERPSASLAHNNIRVTTRQDRLEFEAIDDARSNDKRPVSLYLNQLHHVFYVGAMGSQVFRTLEWALWRALHTPLPPVEIEGLSSLLEHGTALLDLEEARWDPNWVVRQLELAWNDALDPAERTLLRAIGASSEDTSAMIPEVYQRLRKRGWPRTVDGEIALKPFKEFSSLRLSAEVGALEFDTPDLERIAHDLPGRAMSMYGLTALNPESELLAAAIAHRIPLQKPTPAEHPLEYHAAELFRLYADRSLPAAGRSPRRVDRDVLAALAAPEAFRTRRSLEFAGRGSARRTATGLWQIVRSRRVVPGLEAMTNDEAYRVGRLLESLQPEIFGAEDLQPKIFGAEDWRSEKFGTEDLRSRIFGAETLHSDLRSIAISLVRGRLAGFAAQSLRVNLGPWVVGQALELVRRFPKLKVSSLSFPLAVRLAEEAVAGGGGRLLPALLAENPELQKRLEKRGALEAM